MKELEYYENEDDDYKDMEDYEVVLEDEEDYGEGYKLFYYGVYGEDNISRNIELAYSYYRSRTYEPYSCDLIQTNFFVDDKEVNEDTFIKSLNVGLIEFKVMLKILENRCEANLEMNYNQDDC